MVGFLRRLFGWHEPTTELPGPDVMRIVVAYGAALSAQSGPVSDLSALPYPKPEIKRALIAGIKASTNPSLRAQLKDAYVRLSDWQENREAARVAAEADTLSNELVELGL